jgi:excisionase family DNA binding protein
LLTDNEAADVLGISLGVLKELVAGGVLHSAGDSGSRFDAAEVEAALNGTALPVSQPPDAAPPPEPPPEHGQRRVLAVAEVAALYGVDVKTVARWDKKGMLPAPFRTPGGHRRFYEDEIIAQLNATRSRPPL